MACAPHGPSEQWHVQHIPHGVPHDLCSLGESLRSIMCPALLESWTNYPELVKNAVNRISTSSLGMGAISVADAKPVQCADGWFGSRALTQRCAGDIPLSDKTLHNSLYLENQFKWKKDFGFSVFACVCLVLFCFLFAPTADTELLWLKLRYPSYSVSSSPCPESGYKIWAAGNSNTYNPIAQELSCQSPDCVLCLSAPPFLHTNKWFFFFFFLLKSSQEANVLLRLPWPQLLNSFLGNRN